MNEEDKKNVIEFYNNHVWLPSMQKSDTLTEEQIKHLKNTLSFDTWMFSNKLNIFVNSIRDVIIRTH